jgi:hypothetical protein
MAVIHANTGSIPVARLVVCLSELCGIVQWQDVRFWTVRSRFKSLSRSFNAPIAQPAERRVAIAKVMGSKPVRCLTYQLD